MKRREDLMKLLSEPILRAIEVGALEIDWNKDPESPETWVELGYPHRIFISQKIPNDLIECDVRHEIRHIVFSHEKLLCKDDPTAPCVYAAKEIECNRFLSKEQEQAYHNAGIELTSARSPEIQAMFEGTYVSIDHIADFPAAELHAVLCKTQKEEEDGGGEENKEKEPAHCTTFLRPQGAHDTGEAKAGAYLLASTLAKHGYDDMELLQRVMGGLEEKGDLWDKFVMKPSWANKILDILSPELCFDRRRYAPRPLWSPLLLSDRWIPSIRSRYSYRPKRAVIIVDTSGSMFGIKILETIKPDVQYLVYNRNVKVRLICGDVTVTWDGEVEGDLKDFKLQGGGGTLYGPLLCRAKEYEPEEVVFITDLVPNHWPEKPSFPVHFVIPRGFALQPPWGKILCEVDEEDILK